METKHTPGPWYRRNQGSEIEIKSGIYTICMVHNYSGDSNENFSNAKLIKAAPEMMTLLMEEVEYLKKWIADLQDDSGIITTHMKERIEFINLTLKRATE